MSLSYLCYCSFNQTLIKCGNLTVTEAAAAATSTLRSVALTLQIKHIKRGVWIYRRFLARGTPVHVCTFPLGDQIGTFVLPAYLQASRQTAAAYGRSKADLLEISFGSCSTLGTWFIPFETWIQLYARGHCRSTAFKLPDMHRCICCCSLTPWVLMNFLFATFHFAFMYVHVRWDSHSVAF